MNISTSKILQADFKSHKDQQAFAKTFVKTTFVTHSGRFTKSAFILLTRIRKKHFQ